MDQIQALFMANLPPGLLTHLTTHSSTYWTLYQRFLAVSNALQTHFIDPIRTLVLGAISSDASFTSRDLTSIVIMLLVAFVTIQALNFVRRTVMFWIRLTFRIVWWILLASLGLWIWQRGAEGVLQDLEKWSLVWSKEYESWQRKQAVASHQQYRYGGRGYGSRI